MKNQENSKPVKPKGIRIQVTENGVLTANVQIPYFIVKMGLKFGQMADNSKKKGSHEDELERLKNIDIDHFRRTEQRRAFTPLYFGGC